MDINKEGRVVVKMYGDDPNIIFFHQIGHMVLKSVLSIE